MTTRGLDVLDRVKLHVVRVGECDEWTAARDGDGYGLVKVRGSLRRTTRVVWEETFGPIPTGLSVLHACDNPPCVRVDHLMLGSQKANIRDMLQKGRRPLIEVQSEAA